jgi:hypothetical protein
MGDTLRRREQCLERREATPSHRAGAAGLVVEGYRKGKTGVAGRLSGPT